MAVHKHYGNTGITALKESATKAVCDFEVINTIIQENLTLTQQREHCIYLKNSATYFGVLVDWL